MTPREISALYEYDRWATLKMLESVASLDSAKQQQDLGTSFSSIHGTLVHLLSADRVWLQRWLGKLVVPLKPEDMPTIDVLKKQWDAHFLEMENFIRSLNDEVLAAPRPYTDFKGNTHTQPLVQQLQHKVNHSTYHRGQVAVMLRMLGSRAHGTDLITYFRQQVSNG
ncbi:MAG: DinB family protein [Bacteroidetes bacterium]|nr:DinB family protein [Bacteroidota bacterium]